MHNINRRSFIKNIGTGAAAMFVLPRFSIAQSKSPSSKINVACVGVGGIGEMTFNGMGGAKTTKDKARMVLNQILDAAVEDKLISSNPLKSRRLRITGKASKATPPYTVEQMRYLVQHIGFHLARAIMAGTAAFG